ncbi:hypothetical protein Tco_1333998 [Tanacetum coccineum]
MGKGYMHLGSQEVNFSSKPKKDNVPRRKRKITYADNLLKTEDDAVLNQLALRNRDINNKESRHNWSKELPKSIQEKAEKLITKARHTKLHLKKAVEKKFKEYDQKLEALSTINVPEAIEEFVQAKVLTEMKKQPPTHLPKAVANFVKPRLNNTVLELHNILFDFMSLDQEHLNAQDIKPTLKRRPYDDQDPPIDHEGEKRSKIRKDARESSLKSSKKYKDPMDCVQNDIHADQPQDKGEELIHKHPNT